MHFEYSNFKFASQQFSLFHETKQHNNKELFHLYLCGEYNPRKLVVVFLSAMK